MTDYRYQVQGRGGDGEAWFTTGRVTTNGAGSFMPGVQEAMRQSFQDLTQGNAITSLTLSEVKAESTWFNRHERFGDCEPHECYIGMGVFAAFRDRGQLVELRNANDEKVLIDHGSISILAAALQEWKEKNK